MPVFIIPTVMKKEMEVFLIHQKNENCIEKGGKKEFSLFWDLRKLVLQYFFLKKRNSRYINLILLSFPLQCSKFFVFRKKRCYPTLKLIMYFSFYSILMHNLFVLQNIFLNKQSRVLIDKNNCSIKSSRSHTQLTCVKNLHVCERRGCACVYIFIYELRFNILIKLVLNICSCKLFSNIVD